MSKALTFATVALAAVAILSPALAADEHNTSAGFTAAGAPLGLHGVDPVALLDLDNRLDGNAHHAVVHDGVTYYFASGANAETFQANPVRYLPQNGGFCTFGVSIGKKFDGDPRFAAVMDGQLYVFLSQEIFEAFNKDRAGTIAKAAGNWSKIQHTAAADL